MSKKSKLYKIRRKLQVIALKLTSEKTMAKFYYFIRFKQKLNLKNPETFNEKLQWLKLNYYPYDEKVIIGADKYKVREYVKAKGLGYTLNDLIGVWDSWEELNWNTLPQQFALKGNHGQGYNVICEDKSKISEKEVQEKFNEWLAEDFGMFSGERHYSKIEPKILGEKFLGGDITDYKFFCFHGKPMFFYIAKGFGHGENERMTFFNMDGSVAEFQRSDYPLLEDFDLPEKIDEMIEISKKLSEDFPFVRVDLFMIEGKILFSELTFTPSGGLMPIQPEKYYKIWGEYLNLEKLNVKNIEY